MYEHIIAWHLHRQNIALAAGLFEDYLAAFEDESRYIRLQVMAENAI